MTRTRHSAPSTSLAKTPLATRAIGVSRLAVGAFAIAVVSYAYLDAIGKGLGRPLDYFGYFTNQTSLLMGSVLVASGISAVRGSAPRAWLVTVRAIAVSCMIVVAVIYNGLVPGTGSAPPWVSAVLHLIVPVYAVLDWVLVGDRPPLPWARLWIVLPYPLLWLTVVLVRGATDGWVPYGFLLPERGLDSLFMHVLGRVVVLSAAGALIWGASRIPGLPSLLRDRVEAQN